MRKLIDSLKSSRSEAGGVKLDAVGVTAGPPGYQAYDRPYITFILG